VTAGPAWNVISQKLSASWKCANPPQTNTVASSNRFSASGSTLRKRTADVSATQIARDAFW
jgi:hypothetical protein